MIESFRHRYEELEQRPERQKPYSIFKVQKGGERGERLGDVTAPSAEIAELRAKEFWEPMGFKITVVLGVKLPGPWAPTKGK